MAVSPDPSKSPVTDSAYFPGCRKDTNCHCEMCVASIQATLDLVSSRSTIQPSSITNSSAATASDPLKTPKAWKRTGVLRSHPLESTAKSMARKEIKKKETKRGFGSRLVLSVGLVLFLFGADWVVPVVVFQIVGGPKVSPEVVRRIGEELGENGGGFREKLRVLEDRFEQVLGGEVCKCSSSNSTWVLVQDDTVVHMKCVLFSSFAEEISIWGFPFQTSGQLESGLTSRFFTVISGKLIQWLEGKIELQIRREGDWWATRRRSAFATQLSENTWVLEYHQSPFMEEPRLVSLLLEFTKIRISLLAEELKKGEWFLQAPNVVHGEDGHFTPPT